jgi:choline dehydrogenase
MSLSFARRFFLKLLGGAAAAVGTTQASCSPGDDADSSSADLSEDGPFDYIVVGSGAGGGPLAANLARNGFRVLLIEAGDDPGKLDVYKTPVFHARSTEHPDMRWDYFVEHYSDQEKFSADIQDSKFEKAQADRNVGSIFYPRAGALGGCTSHNALIFVYPHASDWNHISEMVGDTSWNADNMRRYLRIVETCHYAPLGDQDHGVSGYLNVSKTDVKVSLSGALMTARLLRLISSTVMAFNGTNSILGGLTGLLSFMNRDLNSLDTEQSQGAGPAMIPMCTDGHARSGPREYISQTAAQFKNLTVMTNALVSKVLFDDAPGPDGKLRATGVEILLGKKLYRADRDPINNAPTQTIQRLATREVIVAAGAFNTPQLLKLSGIGPKEELAQFKIPVKVDLPGVGTNLQDRYEVAVIGGLERDLELLDRCTFNPDDGDADPCLKDWHAGKTNLYTTNGGLVAVTLKSPFQQSGSEGDPDLFCFAVPGKFKGYYLDYSKDALAATDQNGKRIDGQADHHHLSWLILKGHTRNEKFGTVTLRTADPRDTPKINLRYFGDKRTGEISAAAQNDLNAVVHGVKFVRQINELCAADGFSLGEAFTFDEDARLKSASSDEEIAEFVRKEAWGHHASCTCPIGSASDPNAVLDPNFLVRQTSNLRVVDASVFPRIPGFFIVSAIYMISEKATDVILRAAGKTQREDLKKRRDVANLADITKHA